jgi:hypothetical protein
MRALLTVLAAFAAILSTPAMAWGNLGHRTVGAIAMANVKPSTRAAIRALLRHQGEIDTPQCRMGTLEDAATWPDCIKGERWRFAYTSSWHYHDQPVCGTFDLKANCRDGNCATAQIDRNLRLLTDRKLAPVLRLEALSFVVHLVGDVHQPLHIGENEDMGANAVKADYGIAPARNLHSVWDGVLADRAITSARPPLVRVYTASEKAALATGKVEDWERESWQISRDFLYPLAFGGKLPCGVKEPQKIVWSNEAIEQAIPVVDERIERAGLRLAKLLDVALG